MPRKKGRGGGVQESSGPRKWDWVGSDAALGSGSPELLAAWPEERREKAMQWKGASVREKVETLISDELFNEVMNNAEYATVVLVGEFQEVVVALTGQVAILKAEKYAHERMMKGTERECEKLRAEVPRQEDMAEEERKEVLKEWMRCHPFAVCTQDMEAVGEEDGRGEREDEGGEEQGGRRKKGRNRDSAGNARGGCKKGGGREEVGGGG